MMNLIFLLEAAQNRNGIFNPRLAHQDLLETPFQSGIFFYISPVLIEGGCANAMQLAPRKCRLEHIARIHGTLCFTCPDHGVQFINEENHLAFLFAEIGQHGLEPLLKLTPELGAGDE